MREAYSANSREGRLMALLIDELRTVRSLPLHLPQPSDPLLRPICAALSETPDDPRTAAQWAQTIGIDVRTLHRRFIRATTMSFAQWRQQARVLDVAPAAGYASPTALATMVQKQIGMSPSGFSVAAAVDLWPMALNNRRSPARLASACTTLRTAI